eukprot:TRINITY_DN1234_c0_g1_i1.p1 TRINITY_DN1234_c0_g1~~TRINITY_DN1234_c0_g1_i1.p1  ORF type:complete len:103 (-),score=22.61 TRINITY_DN1234_c0_g1_i1:299-607(-)
MVGLFSWLRFPCFICFLVFLLLCMDCRAALQDKQVSNPASSLIIRSGTRKMGSAEDGYHLKRKEAIRKISSDAMEGRALLLDIDYERPKTHPSKPPRFGRRN